MTEIQLTVSTRSGSVEKIPLNQIITTDDIEKNFAFKENVEYQFNLQFDHKKYNTPKLLIGDTLVELKKANNLDEYNTHFERFFLNVYELSCLKVILYDSNNNKTLLVTKLIAVMTRKISANFIEQMLLELEQLDGVILNTLFGKSRINFGIEFNNNNSISAEHFIEKTEKLIRLYKTQLNNFRINPHVKVKQENKLLNYQDVKQINTEGFHWLLSHQDMMKKVNYKTGIEIKGDFYIPSKAMSLVNENETDTYENRVILNTLPLVIKKIKLLKKDIEDLIESNSNDFTIDVPTPVNYEIPINSLNQAKRIYYKLIINRCNNIISDGRELFYQYKNVLQCSETTISYPIKYTSVFANTPHYRTIVNQLIIWDQDSHYSLQGTNYLFKLKSITKVYEFYCLTRILKTLNQLNFFLVESDILKHQESNDGLHNYYSLINNNSNVGIKVYYEPVIKKEVKEDSLLKLYCNSESQWKSPDFVIEFFDTITEKTYYGFFDSKYALYHYVENKYIQDIVVKYYHELSYLEFDTLPSLFTFILHPGFNYNEGHEIIIRNKGSHVNKEPLHLIGYINLDPEFKTQQFAAFFQSQIRKFNSLIS